MIVDNIEVVVFLIILLLGFPIFRSGRKNELWKSFSFIGLIKTLNKSLKVQGIIGLLLILLTWGGSSAKLQFESL